MVSHYKQATLLDCGMACVKTIISYYFPMIKDLEHLKFDVKNNQGLSLYDIELLLKKYKILSDSYEIDDITIFDDLLFPYLLVVERAGLPHYVVVLDGDSDNFTISDPARETIEEISRIDLLSQSVGVILIPKKEDDSIDLPAKNSRERTYPDRLYKSFISSIGWNTKIVVFLLGLIKVFVPIGIAFLLQITMSNFGDIQLSSHIFIIGSLSLALYLFWKFSLMETKLKSQLENKFLQQTLTSFYKNQLENFSVSKNYEYISGYFWNLILSASGMIQKFYFHIHLFIFFILLLLLLKLNFTVFMVTCLCLGILTVYLRYNMRSVAKNQREFIANSSNFSSLVENSISAMQDIVVYQQIESFNDEFKNRMNQLLVTKAESSDLANKLSSSTQLFIGFTGALLIVVVNILGNYNNLLDYTNSILVLILLSTILNTLIMTWNTLNKSQYSFDFINQEEQVNKKDRKILSCSKINKVELCHLSKKWEDESVFSDLNISFESGELSVIIGSNGSGKSSILNILQGLYSPTEGEISINDSEFFASFENTNILDYLSVYSSEFHLFPGSVSKNMRFNIFDVDDYFSEQSNYLDLHLSSNYQINGRASNVSQGQKQKILLSRAILRNSDIYIFDEPTGNLDESSVRLFISEIRKLTNMGKMVIVVTHDNKIVSEADKIINLDDFKLVSE